MAFLTIAQLNTHIYTGVATEISRGDTAIIQDAIDTAIQEAKGYLSRYDVDQIFDNANSLPGYKADPILLMHVKSMAKWHFIVLANPSIDYEDSKERYEQAIKWLLNVQSGKIVPLGFPPATPEEKATFFHINSNPKRNNHF